MQNRSFVDEDEELRKMKEKLVQETGMDDPNAQEQGDDPEHYFDEDDVEMDDTDGPGIIQDDITDGDDLLPNLNNEDEQ